VGAVLGAVFIYASLDKIWKPAEFARIVYHYQLIGPSPTLSPIVPNAFAVVLPWIELVAGLSLVLNIWRREAAAVVAALLVLFLFAVGYALHRGIDIANCGCFTVGESGRQLGASLFVGDAIMLVAALFLVFYGRAPRPIPAVA
jgi:putative oxidoreductase